MKEFKQCIIILIDGGCVEVVEDLLSKDELPNIRKYILKNGTYCRGISTYPSATGPAYAPFLTGCFPGTCDLPGIRWFDRYEFYSKKRVFGGLRSYIGLESVMMKRDLNKEVKTLFELSKNPYNVFNPLSRGIKFSRNIPHMLNPYAHFTHRWEIVDKTAAFFIRRALRKSNPDFLFAVFPAVDGLSHATGPRSSRVIAAYKKIDEMIGQIIGELIKQKKFEDTLFIISSDHGLTDTHTHFDLSEFMEKKNFRVLYYPLIYKRNINMVLAETGNSMANIYIKNGNCWKKRYCHEEIEEKLLKDLANREEISFVLTRGGKNEIYVNNKHGEAIIREKDNKLCYEYSKKDPFGYGLENKWLSYEGILQHTFNSEYPDALVQISQIFKSKRSGDIIVDAKKGFDLRARFEYPEHKSSHGSLCKEHVQVPFFINTKIKRDKIRTIDVFPSVLKLMGKQYTGLVDGKTFI